MPASAAFVIPAARAAGFVGTAQSRSVSDMKAFLTRRGQLTPSESLRLLRNAYPDAPLSLRVAAAGITNG